MVRTISIKVNVADDVARLKNVLAAFGRKRSLRDPIAAACDELDLTTPQVHGLLWLQLDGALTMSELARRLGVSLKTITGTVDGLVALKLVARERDDKDRRVVRCDLTRNGVKVAVKLDSLIDHAMALALQTLSAVDRKDLIRILQSLQRRMEQVDA